MINFFYELNPAIQALIAGTFAFFITSFGSASVFLFKKFNKTLLDGFLSISAGVMIAASFFSLIVPAINMSESLGLTPIIVLLIGILGGTLLLFLGDKILSNKINVSKDKKRTTMLFTSIMLHNIPEGMAVGVCFAGFLSGNVGITIISAMVLSLGIALQNIPEGMVIIGPMLAAGVSAKKTFVCAMLTGVVEVVGALVGYFSDMH